MEYRLSIQKRLSPSAPLCASRIAVLQPRGFVILGLTLVETVVVLAVIAMLVSLVIPAILILSDSLISQSGGKSLISATMATARAIAAKEQRYAGIRFQDLDDKQYMIFIIHDFDNTGLDFGYREIEGIEPISLPDSMGVIGSSNVTSLNEIINAKTFSIIFSSAGKLVIRNVQVISRDIIEKDDIVEESSRNNFIIYDKTKFRQPYGKSELDYLRGLTPEYINPYMGTLIEK